MNVAALPKSSSANARAAGSGQGRGFHGLVQGLRRDVGTVWPYQGPAVEKETLKVALILERFEDRTVQPALQVDRALDVIAECQVNAKATVVLRLDDDR